MFNDAVPKAFHLSGICLFCEQPATSREHFIPSAIGGQEDPPILCDHHNGVVARLCDEPLVAELRFFVNALRVTKARGRGEGGGSLQAMGADGKAYTFDRRGKPVFKMEIQKSDDGKPISAKAPTMEAARKLVKSMGIDPSSIAYEVRVERVPEVIVEQKQATPEILRGILKIAYEFVRGLYNATVVDVDAEREIREALIKGGDPATYVRWLPYEYAGDSDVEFHHHRIVAWHDGEESLVVVELFNCMPYAIRLPGVIIRTAEYYVQGIQGQTAIYSSLYPIPEWHWHEVPEHAEIAAREEFALRTSRYSYLITLTSLLELVKEAADEQLKADGRIHDSANILARVEPRCNRLLTVEESGYVLELAEMCCSGPFGRES